MNKKFLSKYDKRIIVNLLIIVVSLCVPLPAQDYWQITNGPEGGEIRDMVVKDIGTDVFIFAAHRGGVSVYSSNERYWTQTSLTDIGINVFAINSLGDIYAGSYGQGIFYSKDNGYSWVEISEELTNKNIYDLAFTWNNDLLVGTYGGGVFITSNNGESWTSISDGFFTHVLRLAVDRENEILYATVSSQGIYRSTDYGATWIGKGPVDQNIEAILVDPLSNYLFAGTSADGIYRSPDNGDNWELVNSNIFYAQDFTTNTFGHIFIGAKNNGGVYISTDKGLTWGAVNNGLSLKEMLSLAVAPAGQIFAGTEGAGTFRSTDNGSTWAAEKSGLINSTIFSMAVDNEDRVYVGTWGMGVMRTDDRGETWIPRGSGLTSNARSLTINKDNGMIFAGTLDDYVYRSSNDGLTWQQVSQGMTHGYVNALAINYNTGDIFAGTNGGGLFLSENDGTNWTPVSGSWEGDTQINNIVVGTSGIMFISTRNQGVHRSLNNGFSWQPANTGLPAGQVYSMAIDSDGLVYLGIYGGGVYYSKDNGINWIAVNDGLTDWTIGHNGLVINDLKHVFVGTMFSGVFRLTDYNGSWTNVSDGLFHKMSYALELDSQGFLYLGTLGGGVFRSVKSTTAVSANFTVKMLYQNGFNPVTDRVSVQGNFNNWGGTGNTILLKPGGDEHLTYRGEWSTNKPDTISTGIMGGVLEYQFVHLDIEAADTSRNTESFYRSVEWDGAEDISLKTCWFNEVENNQQDSLVLAELYNSTNGDNWTNNTNWLSSHPFRQWHGINAYQGRVIELSLDQNNLQGSLPESIDNLTELLNLFVIDNNLQGPLPASIGNLENLGGLYLNSNNFTGILPDTFSNLTNLKYLLLSDNNFSGSLPPSIYKLIKLRELKIGRNQFSGIINPQITNLSVLESLWIDENQFEELPDLTGLNNLSSAHIQNNKLTFEDIEPNIGLTGLTYSPQDSVGAPMDTLVTEGASLNLKVTVGGANNQYQWYHDGSIIDGATDNSYMIASLAASHAGIYNCAITNTIVTDLTLWSHPITVNILTIPEKPVLSSPANEATDVVTNPVLSWNTVSGADSFRLQLDDNSDFSSLILDENGITQTSYQISDLNENTTYHWRVSATNDNGTSEWSDPWYFTTKSSAGLTPPTLTSPENGQTDVPINPILSWNSTVGGTFHLQLDTDMAFNPPEMKIPGLSSSGYQVGPLNFNETYYWRVNVSSSGDSSDWSLIWSFTTKEYPSQVNVNTTLSFPTHERRDEYSANDYRLFGIPGNHNVMLESVIGSGVGEQWQAYWDNGLASDYFIKYDGGKSEFRCVTGRAFWVLYNGSFSVNENVSSAPLNGEQQAEIQLHTGWNLITNPFSFDVDWSQVQAVNAVTQPLWSFNGSWSQTNVLKYYQGYYFNNNNDLPILKIPYTVVPIAKPFADSYIDWQVTITLISQGMLESCTRFGVSQHAEKGLDDMDFAKPRAVGEIPSVYFNRPKWCDGYDIFASDIRPPVTDFMCWEFCVLSPNKAESALEFSGLEDISEDLEIHLFNKSSLSSCNLRELNTYRFIPVTKISDFQVVIGKKEFVDAHLKTLIPQEYSLGKNYPNPFNPSTTVPVILPQQSEIELNIYNILGQRVKNLYKGYLNTGKHYFVWDGTDDSGSRLSSGIYIYRLSVATGAHFTGKMVMLK